MIPTFNLLCPNQISSSSSTGNPKCINMSLFIGPNFRQRSKTYIAYKLHVPTHFVPLLFGAWLCLAVCKQWARCIRTSRCAFGKWSAEHVIPTSMTSITGLTDVVMVQSPLTVSLESVDSSWSFLRFLSHPPGVLSEEYIKCSHENWGCLNFRNPPPKKKEISNRTHWTDP